MKMLYAERRNSPLGCRSCVRRCAKTMAGQLSVPAFGALSFHLCSIMLNQSSDDANRLLFYLVEGDPDRSVFGVEIPANKYIVYLKKIVYEEINVTVPVKDLILLKVTTNQSPA
jgi:hypothetical protein